MTDDSYVIRVQAGESKDDFYGTVTEVLDEMPSSETMFVARLSEAEVTSFVSDDRIFGVANINAARASEVDDADSSPPVHRLGVAVTATQYAVGHGNWCLHRHTSQTNNFTSVNLDHTNTFSYPQDGGVDVDGTGVDMVFITSAMLDVTNAQYETGGVSRIVQYQWNTEHPVELASVPTVNYATGAQSDHSELVVALACSNTYGWAQGAAIYIIPRNVVTNPAHRFEAPKVFHEAKVAVGNTRPTIVVGAYGHSTASSQEKIHFRGTDYTSYRGYDTKGGSQGPDRAHVGLAVNTATRLDGQTPFQSNTYGVEQAAVQDMLDVGVHQVMSAGNEGQKIDVPGGPDYDNFWESTRNVSPWTVGGVKEHINSCRQASVTGSNTIIVGNLSSTFGELANVTKEILSPTSSRGPRVDCVMGGTNLTIDRSDYGVTTGLAEYTASGTSFSAPQVAGILAMVLQKYPLTTPAQARKYFREHAIGTDLLHDTGITPVSDQGDYGDLPYFDNSLMGNSTNILYLDPAMAFDPSGIVDTTITYPTETLGTSRIAFTLNQINAILTKAQ